MIYKIILGQIRVNAGSEVIAGAFINSQGSPSYRSVVPSYRLVVGCVSAGSRVSDLAKLDQGRKIGSDAIGYQGSYVPLTGYGELLAS